MAHGLPGPIRLLFYGEEKLQKRQPSILRAAMLLGLLTAGAGADPVTVSGTFLYTGRTGAENAAGSNDTFNVRGAAVELWSNGSFLETGFTGNDGKYAFTADDGDGTASFQVKLFARSNTQAAITSAYSVVQPGARVGGNETAGTTYHWDSAVINNVSSDQVINNTFGANGSLDRAFSVYDVLTTISRNQTTLPGAVQNTIAATFATADGTSNFSGGLLHILDGDRYDWDVDSHEYSHFVESTYGISAAVGGSHSSLNNLRFSRGVGGSEVGAGSPAYNRRQANQLAWSEGLATYLGMSGEAVQGVPAGVQRAGDAIYNDNDDADGTTQGLRYGIENRSIGNRPARGEDNEASVARILWDLYDATNDAADRDRVALGANKVFKTMNDAKPTTLSDFWNALINLPGTTDKDRIDYGAIFESHNSAAIPDEDLDGESYNSGDVIPTFDWAIPQGGQNGTFNTNLFNDFGLKFFDAAYIEIFDSGFLGDVTTFTPTAVDWENFIFNLGTYHWIVYAKDVTTENTVATDASLGTFEYTSGAYWSDALTFTTVPEPATLLVLAGLSLAALRRGERRRRA
jgi:hypothetical protein